MSRQTTSHLLMIRPVRFMFNAQTATNNAFQSANDERAQALAIKEFDDFAALLRRHNVDVTVLDDTATPHTPDSIFPNNWISFHDDGTIILYPMYAVNRRPERKPHVLKKLEEKFTVTRRFDLSGHERSHQFLEGTGSMVLDRQNKIAYACLSDRTDPTVLNEFCSLTGFTAHTFSATDARDYPVYHTNVMMCIADTYAVVCLDSVKDAVERSSLTTAIQNTKKEIITIALDQMDRFAGNMLQVCNLDGQAFLVMSSQAYRSLSADQITRITSYNPILHSNLETIERNGGGSARCMMAEVFLPGTAGSELSEQA